jgi:hypothetical protein
LSSNEEFAPVIEEEDKLVPKERHMPLHRGISMKNTNEIRDLLR